MTGSTASYVTGLHPLVAWQPPAELPNSSCGACSPRPRPGEPAQVLLWSTGKVALPQRQAETAGLSVLR